jgi:repressor LexA
MLTKKQRELYEYISRFIQSHQMAPTISEIREFFGLGSNFSIQKKLNILRERGYISFDKSNAARNIRLTGMVGETVVLDILGMVTAGIPIEAIEIPEPVEVPRYLLKGTNNFALRVRGDSMMDANIEDGDVIIVKPQLKAENGQIVVATINGEATVKKLDLHAAGVTLRPCNRSGQYKPIHVQEDDEFVLKGVVVGLLRQYQA